MGCIFGSRQEEGKKDNLKTEDRKKVSGQNQNQTTKKNPFARSDSRNKKPENFLQIEELDRKKEHKTFRGIQNLGNTCFMNSILQSLAHTSEFMKNLGNENEISQTLCSALYSLTNKENTVQKVQIFINEISKLNPIWRDKKPHDCKEFLVFLLNSLTNQQTNVFSWTFEKNLAIGCGKHNEIVTERKYFFTIHSLSPEAIINSIAQKTKPNRYKEYFCNKCNREFSCDETWKIKKTPTRFVFYIEPSNSKTTNLKDIEEIMFQNTSLTLYAAIISIEMNIRHFVALCKENSGWIIYNDDRVSPYKTKTIDGLYMLFYKST